MPEEYENLAESAQDTITERQQEAHQKEARPEWLDALAVSTALFAVLAAFASSPALTYRSPARREVTSLFQEFMCEYIAY